MSLGCFNNASYLRQIIYLEKNVLEGKNSKVPLTGKVAASAIGENLQMYLVGKFKHPRFFKNIKHLPCQYKKQKKKLDESRSIRGVCKKLDSNVHAQIRIMLLVKKCPSHPQTENVNHANISFFHQTHLFFSL